ncbi:hypothetical protein [Paraburkholderia sp. WP4_3_2]|uniref:hypothetical protein n=1 Tax=Paraburkholderia sp. WP4_3_2 TaxID=2587162 RepID=UPI00160CC693|nr:hypothetical protein [Paraburkholderia sp. WP4_3_2]MBB3256899.1 hypothetical protein [Paraburkholderia sp. WP4_3_2]
MNIIGWIFFAVLLSVFVGSLLGKYLAWCFREPIERKREVPTQADEAYPHWYE